MIRSGGQLASPICTLATLEAGLCRNPAVCLEPENTVNLMRQWEIKIWFQGAESSTLLTDIRHWPADQNWVNRSSYGRAEIMRVPRFWTLIAVLILSAFAQLKADESATKWVNNLDEAKRIAQATNRDLLINITGLSWCGYCKRLEADVFSKPAFAVAGNDFVLVEIDYPGTDDRLEGDMKEWFPKLRDYYMVAGYPTVVIADASGLPVAFTGYRSGITPEKVLKELATYRAGRQARDNALAEAAQLAGEERAKKLDEALNAVNLNLGSMYSRKVDPLFAFYGNIVDEIKSLSSDSGKIVQYYERRTATRKEWDQHPGVAIFEELKRFKGVDDAPAAIAYIEQMLTSVQDDDLRWRLELARQTQMELSSARKDASKEEEKLICENALANARRLLSLPPKTDNIRERVLVHEAYMLRRLGRVDEMVNVYDVLIRDAAEIPAKRLALLRRKATSLIYQPDVERTIVAFREYQAATEAKSEKWCDATGMIAFVLERADRKKEAIEVHKQVIEADPEKFGEWLAIARDQHSLGLLDDARKSLAEAEDKAQSSFAKNVERPNKVLQARFKEEVARLRELIGSGS